MSDNPLKAAVDAIAEEDNEIGGFLITRLRQAQVHGRDDGSLSVGSDVLTSPTDVFAAYHVGQLIDVLAKSPPNGNQQTCVVVAVTPPFDPVTGLSKTVQLTTIDGAVPVFVNESDVRWRFASLRVESTHEFPASDQELGLWVGDENEVIPYGGVMLVPGACEFRGLGEQRYSKLGGVIDVAAPITLKSIEPMFAAGAVGATVWIYPKTVLTGNEGPRRILAYVDSRTVTVAGPPFAASETQVRFALKTYARSGYLTRLQPEHAEVIDASGSYSALDLLRRAVFSEYAVQEEIDRCARNYGLQRVRGLTDEILRRWIQVRAYMPATTVEAFENALEALFPEGGYTFYEDLTGDWSPPPPAPATATEPAILRAAPNLCSLFITVPYQSAGTSAQGKTFLEQIEDLTSTDATHVTAGSAPITVEEVRLQPVNQSLEMAGLPSAETPSWPYVNDGEIEANTFSVDPEGLLHTQDRADANGGRYARTVAAIGQGRAIVHAWWKARTVTAIGGHPWKLCLRDGAREYCLGWDMAEMVVGDAAEAATLATIASVLVTGRWYLFSLEHLSDSRGDRVRVYLDGVPVAEIDAASFGASVSTDVSFGYHNLAANQNWLALWGRVTLHTWRDTNFWNLSRSDGVLAGGGSDVLSSVAALWVAGDTDKIVRLYGANNENSGSWLVTHLAADQFQLRPIMRAGATVQGVGAAATIELDRPWFDRQVVGKQILLAAGADPLLNLPGPYTVLEWISDRAVRVNGPVGGFVYQSGCNWGFDVTAFVAEIGIRWELVAAGSKVGAVLTLREALPAALSDVTVSYTAVRSAQLLQSESVRNSPADSYWPAYLFDVDAGIRSLLDDVKASGMMVKYERSW